MRRDKPPSANSAGPETTTSRVAFYCATPFQIIMAFAILRTLDENAVVDIYVLNHFRDADRITLNLTASGRFNKCTLVDSRGLLDVLARRRPRSLRGSGLIRWVQTAWCFLRYRSICSKYLHLTSERYDDVYLSYPDLVIQLGIKHHHRYNHAVRVHLFEDGTGSYDAQIWTASIRKRVFNWVAGNGNVIDAYSELLVFRPELVTEEAPFPIRRLEPLGRSSETIRAIVAAFDYRPATLEERVVFLEQPLEFVPGLDRKIAEIARDVLPSGTLVKMHPRGRSALYGDFAQFSNPSVPWELVALTNSMEDCILVSFFSTAATTSKIMFDAEPHVIMLYGIPELRELWDLPDTMKEFVGRLRASYSEPSKISVPESITECREEIRRRLATRGNGEADPAATIRRPQ